MLQGKLEVNFLLPEELDREGNSLNRGKYLISDNLLLDLYIDIIFDSRETRFVK